MLQNPMPARHIHGIRAPVTFEQSHVQPVTDNNRLFTQRAWFEVPLHGQVDLREIFRNRNDPTVPNIG
jgi:hypothetical protein